MADDLLAPQSPRTPPTHTGTTPAVEPAGSRSRRWHIVIVGVATLAVLATCGLFSYQLLQDELAGRGGPAEMGAPTAPPPRDISSREVDPDPLTEDEVFPTTEIVINPDEPPYEVLGTQHSDDCMMAATDDLAELLAELDCSQVVRGTLLSPTEEYLITTGVFNLATEDEAEYAYDEIPELISNQTGRFLGMVAGEGTDPIVLSQTHVGYDFRGHYLIYAVFARTDGADLSSADDRQGELILWDMVEVHLRSGILEERATESGPAPDATDGAGDDDDGGADDGESED